MIGSDSADLSVMVGLGTAGRFVMVGLRTFVTKS